MHSSTKHDDHHQHHGENHEGFDPGAMYSQAWVQDQIQKIQDFIRANVAWIGIVGSMDQRVLDYACGHGTISLALTSQCPHAVFRGLDCHPKQVQRYNEEAQKLFGPNKNRMYAIQGDLSNPSSTLSDPEWSKFDVVIISMALHHVFEPVQMLTALRMRLNSGGSLLIVEWNGEDHDAEDKTTFGSLDEDEMIEVHGGQKIWRGFTSRGLERMLMKAGFVDIEAKLPGLTFNIPDAGGLIAGEKQLLFVKAINMA